MVLLKTHSVEISPENRFEAMMSMYKSLIDRHVPRSVRSDALNFMREFKEQYELTRGMVYGGSTKDMRNIAKSAMDKMFEYYSDNLTSLRLRYILDQQDPN